MTRVWHTDEVGCEVGETELPDLSFLTDRRKRLVAAAGLVSDLAGMDAGRALTVLRSGVLLLAWGDRAHLWAITDQPGRERELIEAVRGRWIEDKGWEPAES